jgi:hypothetical protein
MRHLSGVVHCPSYHPDSFMNEGVGGPGGGGGAVEGGKAKAWTVQ